MPAPPLVIARTPLRISFLGGGSDYPEYFTRRGGRVLAAAIDRHTLVTVGRLAPSFGYAYKVGYSRTEEVQEIDEIEHPVVRACLGTLDVPPGIHVQYVGELPAGAGLGASSSFTVGLLHALHVLRGDEVDAVALAEQAVRIEREQLGETVGVQDPFTCALGGLRHLEITTAGRVTAELLPVSPERLAALCSQLMLCYTGRRREARRSLGMRAVEMSNGRLDTPLARLVELSDEGRRVLLGDGDLRPFGELLHEAWQIKRRLAPGITADGIDGHYARARAAGAVGGKLLGGGGGGFFLLCAPPDKQDAIAAALPWSIESFSFEKAGTTLVAVER